MENDLYPFTPDVVTLCYGMNDGRYKVYDEDVGRGYREPMEEIVAALKERGVTVLVGSPGCVDSVLFHPWWNKDLTPDAYNESLARLRDIAREVAEKADMPFANVYDPLLRAMQAGKQDHGETYHTTGPDGFHPRENGQLIMAYVFLEGLGLDGDLGRIAIDMAGEASATGGHRVLSSSPGTAEIMSTRHPFCFPKAESVKDEEGFSAREALAYVPFNEELNRLVLVVRNLGADRAAVTWGGQTRTYSKKELEEGINLAAEFLDNPFSEVFAALDERVAQKQAFETFAIQSLISGLREQPDALRDSKRLDGVFGRLREELHREERRLQQEVRDAVVPVIHRIEVTAK